MHGDLHEFLITSRGTALITIYQQVTADLTSIGGSVDGQLVVGVIQELDIPTGKVLFEWRSDDAHPARPSRTCPRSRASNVDYFHLNSVGVDLDGTCSSRRGTRARSTSWIARPGDQVAARRQASDFTIVPGADFNYPARRPPPCRRHAHDLRQRRRASAPHVETSSRPLRLALDMKRDDARRSSASTWPADAGRWAMGNSSSSRTAAPSSAGAPPALSPSSRRTARSVSTRRRRRQRQLRAFRAPWVGRPAEPPKVAITRNGGSAIAHVSWNGATEVAKWRVGHGLAARARSTQSRPRGGPVRDWRSALGSRKGYLALTALDAAGKVLDRPRHRLV